MNGLITDRFLKRFLKGFHRPTKPGVVPETLEKAVELTYEPHHLGGVNGAPKRVVDPQGATCVNAVLNLNGPAA